MGHQVSFYTRAKDAAFLLPKTAWLAAVIVPGGLVAVGLWLVYKSTKEKTK